MFPRLPQYLKEGFLWRDHTVHTLRQVSNELGVPQEAVNEAVTGLAEGEGRHLDLLPPPLKHGPSG